MRTKRSVLSQVIYTTNYAFSERLELAAPTALLTNLPTRTEASLFERTFSLKTNQAYSQEIFYFL